MRKLVHIHLLAVAVLSLGDTNDHDDGSIRQMEVVISICCSLPLRQRECVLTAHVCTGHWCHLATPLTVQGDTNANSVRLLGRSSDDRTDIQFYEKDGSTFIAVLSPSNLSNLFLGSSRRIKITGNPDHIQKRNRNRATCVSTALGGCCWGRQLPVVIQIDYSRLAMHQLQA